MFVFSIIGLNSSCVFWSLIMWHETYASAVFQEKHFRVQLLPPAFFNILLLQATGGGYNPKCLGCYYTCAVVCMWPMFVCTSSKNEWSVENVIRLCAFQPSTSCNVIMHVLTICEVKLMQSSLMEQKHLYFWLLSPSVMLSKPLLISSY